MKRVVLIAQLIVSILLFGCVTGQQPNIVDREYRSPNGGFDYYIFPKGSYEEVRVLQSILPEGGNVQFIQRSQLRRIDYANLNPTAEKQIQDKEFRKGLIKNFTEGTLIPSILKYAPKSIVKSSAFQETNNVPLFYVSLFLPESSYMTANGKPYDTCRCMLTHATTNRMFVFTVSGDVDPRDGDKYQDAFAHKEEWLKKQLSQFFDSVNIR